jgi:hypothetical protein
MSSQERKADPMHDPQTTRQARLAREKALYRYTMAFELGDMTTIADVWHEAEQDAVLEQMILDMHGVYSDEDRLSVRSDHIAQARNRLLALVDEQEAEEEAEIGTLPSGPLKRGNRRGMRFLLQTIAAVLIICVLIGSAFLIFANRGTQVGSHHAVTSGNWKLVTGLNPGTAQNNLSAVAPISANDVWAVGYYSNSRLGNQGGKTLIEHWNGLTWSIVKSPNSALGYSYLNGVAAIAPNNIWAVGYTFNAGNYGAGQALIEHWNGSSWAIVNSPNPGGISALYAVTPLSATNIWAVGEYGNTGEQPFIEHWDGTSWKVIQSPRVGTLYAILNSISAISANDIWAVGVYANKTVIGNSETLLEHWNGTSWTVVPGPNSGGFLSSVAAISAHDVWAVGNIGASGNTASGYQGTQTLVEHWNGSSWRIVKSLNPGIASNIFNAVTVLSARDVYAVGYTSNNFADQERQPLIEHWNGSSWSVVNGPTIASGLNNLSSVTWVPGSTKIWAVGDREYDATEISISSPNATQTLLAPSFASSVLIASCCS